MSKMLDAELVEKCIEVVEQVGRNDGIHAAMFFLRKEINSGRLDPRPVGLDQEAVLRAVDYLVARSAVESDTYKGQLDLVVDWVKANTRQPSPGALGAAALIPTTWLDPLLTGPNAVIGGAPYDEHDIVNLLNAVKKRIETQPPTP